MEKLIKKLREISSASYKRPAVMTHVVLGYPTLKESVDLVRVMADSGASLIELQIPFSDPIADGPTIMAASTAALGNKVHPKDCMKAMAKLSSLVEVPLLFMSYLNPVLRYNGGIKGFLEDAKRAGAQGLIVPDIPLEEAADGYWTMSKACGVFPVPLVSPVTSPDRLRTIAKHLGKEGFVYCVSTTATTGAKKDLPEGLKSYLANVKKYFKIPRAVGFGISKPEHVRALRGSAEIVIVGSAVVSMLKDGTASERRKRVGRFVGSLVG